MDSRISKIERRNGMLYAYDVSGNILGTRLDNVSSANQSANQRVMQGSTLISDVNTVNPALVQSIPNIETNPILTVIEKPNLGDSSLIVRLNFNANTAALPQTIVLGDVTGAIKKALSGATTYVDGFTSNMGVATTNTATLGGAVVEDQGFRAMFNAVNAVVVNRIKTYSGNQNASTASLSLYVPPQNFTAGANKVVDFNNSIPINQGTYQAGVTLIFEGELLFPSFYGLVIVIPPAESLQLELLITATPKTLF